MWHHQRTAANGMGSMLQPHYEMPNPPNPCFDFVSWKMPRPSKSGSDVVSWMSCGGCNSKDTKNYEKGVWTLPPVLALKEQDKAKYLAIGESDRFTLRFVKPKK